MESRGPIYRPFMVSDAMILVAATAAGLGGYSSANLLMEPCHRDVVDIKVAICCLVTLAVRSAHPLISAWTLAWILIRLRHPRSSLRRLSRQSGMSAMLAASMGWGVGKAAVFLSYLRQFHEAPSMATMGFYNGIAILLGGFGVLVAWVGAALAGRWYADPGWIDRLGRGLAIGWLVSFILLICCSDSIDAV
jgi:hypothetical protein